MKPWSRGSAALAALLLCCAAGWLWTRLPAEEAAPADAAAPVPAEGPKYVALTFDDGPKGRITERLLDGLAQRGVKASFFLIGTLAEEYPDLVGRMAAELLGWRYFFLSPLEFCFFLVAFRFSL